MGSSVRQLNRLRRFEKMVALQPTIKSAPAALQLGLRALGGSHWIAGVNYLHSLLYGNSLLLGEERADMRVYLDFQHHRVSDYQEVRRFSAGIHPTDFYPAPTRRLYRRLRRLGGTVVRQRRWPAMPRRDLPRLLHNNRTDVLFAGTFPERNIRIPQICWIPDFQHVYHPEFFSAQERQNRDRLFADILTEADRVIVSNHSSYADAIRLQPEARPRVMILPFTMYLGRDWRNRDAQRVVRKHNLPDKFLLFPSQFWKHKNHLTLFRAISLLHQRGIDDAALVCTGFTQDSRFPDYAHELEQFLSRLKPRSAVRVLGLLPRHDQVQLMRAAAAIVQPSLFEGWSAVVEEARSIGKRIFASDIPMHREQLSKRMHLFDPTSAEELANLLAQYWPQLAPGPEPEFEAAAEVKYNQRIREFALQFVTCCDDAAKTGR